MSNLMLQFPMDWQLQSNWKFGSLTAEGLPDKQVQRLGDRRK
jgi:hypothetical protein